MYQKSHPQQNEELWHSSIFFVGFCYQVMADKKEERKNKLDIFVVELLNCTKGNLRVAPQYTSEANLSESPWLDCASRFTRALIYFMYIYKYRSPF